MSRPRILTFVAMLFLVLLANAPAALAQPAPANMRGGSQGGVGPGGMTLYTVPVGQTFVLTDFTWTSYPFYPVTGLGTLISVSSGVAGTPRWSWWAFDVNTTAPGDHENPVGAHWSTGLPFDAGSQLAVLVGAQAMPPNVTWIASWSGYLSPGATSAVPASSGSGTGLNLSPAPNPSQRRVDVDFRLQAKGEVLLAIFDVRGHRIRTLVSGEMPAGAYSIPWDGNDSKGHSVESGMYFARLVTPEASEVRKLTRLR